MSSSRSSFSGKLGFVLATAGSAVGLGNIWRFPYLAAKYGGGIFLFFYIVLVLTFGFALSCAEILIGRKTGQSAINAFASLNKKWSFVGWIASIIPVLILPYYSVIGGWIIKYLVAFIGGGAKDTANGNYFVDYMGQTGMPILWFLIFLIATALVVILGVEKGIEKASKILMPALVILILFISIYTILQPEAAEGLKYYLVPDFNKFSFKTVLAAMGQLFYSMSLAMGIMITFGSYMKKDVSVSSSVHQIEIFDTGIAFLAGLMVVPAVFAFSGAEDINKGAGLMFMTLPKVFNNMPGGTFIGILFFVMVLLAALTSSISLMETVVSFVCDRTKLTRKVACILVVVVCVVLGIPSALGNGVAGVWDSVKLLGFCFLDFFDFISNSVLMPVCALLTCIFVGYVIKPKALIEEAELSGKFSGKKLFTIIIRYIAPIFIVLILGFSVLEAFGYIKV